jgi:ABC-type antimicrobial peptide transport system permease subunit
MDVTGVPHLYFSIYQFSGRSLALVTRSIADPTAMAESLRREVQAVDPTLPVFGVRKLDDLVNASMAQQRFSAELMGAFAFLAMLLAATGIYGVLAYAVGQRTREIGIRMALGARQIEVIRMVLWNGLRPILAGIALGLGVAWVLSGVLQQLLYGVSVTDPVVFVTVPLLLIAVALVASYVPAMRATRIDPIQALRAE